MLKSTPTSWPKNLGLRRKEKFAGASKSVSEALGRKPQSTDLNERHPFDVEILRIPAGKIPYPYHSHSAQWEFYHVISGQAACDIMMEQPQSRLATPLSSSPANPSTHQRQHAGPGSLRGGGQSIVSRFTITIARMGGALARTPGFSR